MARSPSTQEISARSLSPQQEVSVSSSTDKKKKKEEVKATEALTHSTSTSGAPNHRPPLVADSAASPAPSDASARHHASPSPECLSALQTLLSRPYEPWKSAFLPRDEFARIRTKNSMLMKEALATTQTTKTCDQADNNGSGNPMTPDYLSGYMCEKLKSEINETVAETQIQSSSNYFSDRFSLHQLLNHRLHHHQPPSVDRPPLPTAAAAASQPTIGRFHIDLDKAAGLDDGVGGGFVPPYNEEDIIRGQFDKYHR